MKKLPTLLILKGLPASGKSTYAKELALQPEWKRWNKDDQRQAIDGKWSPKNEKFLLKLRDNFVELALLQGYNVVIDDTNLDPKHEVRLREIADGQGNPDLMDRTPLADVGVKFFEISVEEAIKRDLNRPVSVGSGVIKDMYNRYLKPPVDAYKPADGLPRAIVVDVDGTLAHNTSRNPYDATLYHTDTVDPVIAEMVNLYRSYFGDELTVIVCSGRDDTYMPETGQWLTDHGIQYDQILMRPIAKELDLQHKRNDAVVKREIFDEFIRDKYNVLFVLDDRDRVVEMWRSLGLKVLQVAEGAF